MGTQVATDWAFEADYLQACSCAYGCPCEFQAPPTEGYCEGNGFWHIRQGHFRDVPLDGLTFGFALHAPGALHEGNLKLCLVVDEQADERQREAILEIASGQAGGMPFEAIATLVGEMLEPQYVPFETHLDGVNSSMKIGDVMEIALAPIINPVTQEPESIRIEHGTGFMFTGADVCAGAKCTSTIPGLEFDHPDRAGFVTRVRYPM